MTAPEPNSPDWSHWAIDDWLAAGDGGTLWVPGRIAPVRRLHDIRYAAIDSPRETRGGLWHPRRDGYALTSIDGSLLAPGLHKLSRQICRQIALANYEWLLVRETGSLPYDRKYAKLWLRTFRDLYMDPRLLRDRRPDAEAG